MRTLASLLLLTSALLWAPRAALADSIVLLADEWCPYNCDGAATDKGYMLDIAEAVFSKAGHTIEYKQMSWTRSISAAREGKANGIIGAAKGDAEDFVFPDNSLGLSVSAVFVAKGAPWRYVTGKGAAQFEPICVGAIQDYDYGENWADYFEENAKNPKKVQLASGDGALEQNFQKLLKGRVDAVVDDKFVLGYTAESMGVADKVEFAGEAADADDVYIAFSPADPKSAQYAKLLSDGVEELRKSGELAAILAKYGLKDWK